MMYTKLKLLESLDKSVITDDQATALNAMCSQVFDNNVKAGWWTDLKTGERIERNKGELIALLHSELSEMLEAVRKNKLDDHIIDLSNEAVEAADVLIRLLEYCGAYGIDLGTMVQVKSIYNAKRSDHKLENRADGGKQF